MIAFLTILYVAAVLVVFKVLKVKPRPWPIASFVAAGIIMLTAVTVLWTLAAPISSKAVVSRYVVQIVPQVAGQVISIPAEPNVPMKKGDVLYEIDPSNFQATVNQFKAQLQAAKSGVQQAEAAVKVTEANIEKAATDVTAKKADFDVAVAIDRENPQAIAKLKLVQAEQTYAAAQAALTQAKASEAQAKAAVVTAQDNVASIAAQLQVAENNLDYCVVRAPADGFITAWEIREGTYVVPMPLAAAGTFVDTSETMIVASYPAQMLLHVRPGDEVELTFKSNPGALYRGKVQEIIPASGEGQFAPSGKLESAAQIGSAGYLAVKIQLDNPQVADELAMGTAGTVAIYTDWGKSFGMISRVAIRMQKWLYFVPLPTK